MIVTSASRTRLDWSNLNWDHLDKRFLGKNSNLSNNSIEFKHENTSTHKEAKQDQTRYHYFTLGSTETDVSLGSFMTYNMMQDVLCVLTKAFKPKLGVSAGGMAHTRISL
jgi:hypothetical protein